MKKKAILIAIIALVVLFGGVAGAKFFLEEKVKTEHEATISSIAQGADDIVASIRNVLQSKAPTTWVYDRDMNLIMTVKLSNALQGVAVVPDEIAASIVASGNLPRIVAQEYLVNAGVTDPDSLEGYSRRVQVEFSQEELVRYLASSSNFGGNYTGLTDAASNIFGVSVEKLSAVQSRYLAYTYRNESATVDDFLLRNEDVTLEQLHTLTGQEAYRALRELILEELQEIQGVDMKSTSYNVQITLSSQQQTKLQNLIDLEMRQLIELNSDGTYAVDCSAMVIDNNGRIRAYAPRRSSNIRANSVFKLNSLNFADNLTQLIKDLSVKDACWLTLQKVKTPNGDTVYLSLADLFSTLALSNSSDVSGLSAKDVVELMYSQNPSYPGFGIIHEVQTIDGSIIYTWPSNRLGDFDVLPGIVDSTVLNASHKVYEFFSEDKDRHTAWGFDVPIGTGIVSFHHTSNYTIAIVTGTAALGGSVNATTRETLSGIISKICEDVRTDYPTEGKILWPSGFEDLISLAYTHNAELVKPLYDKALGTLTQVQINSVDARRSWESAYKAVVSLLQQYQEYLSPATVSEWMSAVDANRKANAEALLRYSA